MSRILDDIVSNKTSLEVALQRLLVIANKTQNKEISKWCIQELNGYNSKEELPKYRMFKDRSFFYSGINGAYKITDTPLGAGYLSNETLSKIENVYILDNFKTIEEKTISRKDSFKDFTYLAPEVLENTNDGLFGVQCTSIKQLIPYNFYSFIYSNVKTRIINLLCFYENNGINLDKFDISKNKINRIKKNDKGLYSTVILKGEEYDFKKIGSSIVWNIIVPIITGIITGVIVYFITAKLNI